MASYNKKQCTLQGLKFMLQLYPGDLYVKVRGLRLQIKVSKLGGPCMKQCTLQGLKFMLQLYPGDLYVKVRGLRLQIKVSKLGGPCMDMLPKSAILRRGLLTLILRFLFIWYTDKHSIIHLKKLRWTPRYAHYAYSNNIKGLGISAIQKIWWKISPYI